MRNLINIFILLAVFFLYSCYFNKNYTAQSTIKIRVNEVLKINLKFISGTGYDWFMEENPNFKIVNSYVVDKDNRNLLGREVIKIFEVKALKPGNYVLIFNLKRPWEEKIEEKSIFYVEVLP